MVEILIMVLCLGPFMIILWYIFEIRGRASSRKFPRQMWEKELGYWRRELREFKYFREDGAGALQENDYRKFEKEIREIKEDELRGIKEHIQELERKIDQPLPATNFWHFYRDIILKWVPSVRDAVFVLIFGVAFVILGVLMLVPGIEPDIAAFIEMDWQWERIIAPYVLLAFGILVFAMGCVRLSRSDKQVSAQEDETGKKP